MTGIFSTAIAFVVALASLIAIHEAGHFLAAKWCGVKVLRFSIGFGRPLLTWRSGPDSTEWVVSAFPLGGYVKMLDEGEGLVSPSELARAFNRKPLWARAIIVAAGPVANFLFAVVLYFAMGLQGSQQPRPILGNPDPGSIAALAGIKANDEVLKIEGEGVRTWQELRWRLLQLGVDQKTVLLDIRSDDGPIRQASLDLGGFSLPDDQSDPIAKTGLHLYRPPIPAIIGRLTPGGVAERAGLQAGDKIISAGGRRIGNWADLVETVRANPGKSLVLEIVRSDSNLMLTAIPEGVPDSAGTGATIGRIGAAPRPPDQHMEKYWVLVSLGPIDSAKQAVLRTGETAWFSLRMLGRMIAGELSWKNLSGPVTIAEYAGQSAQLGVAPFLSFLALISISLGVLNLLPIPLLDGGHLLYYGIEYVTGRPISGRLLELGQRLGFSIIILATSLAIFNDLRRVFFN